MLGHRRPPNRRLFDRSLPGRRLSNRRVTAIATGITVVVTIAGCSSGSDSIPVPGADDVVTAPLSSADVASTTLPVVTDPLSDGPLATDPLSTDPLSTSETPSAETSTTAPVATESAPDGTAEAATTPAGTTAASTVPVTEAPTDDVFLRVGDEGDEVGLMQFKLSVLDYLPVGSDTGVFDQATEDGLRRFQSDYGLGVDGVFGPITGRALNAAVQSVRVES